MLGVVILLMRPEKLSNKKDAGVSRLNKKSRFTSLEAEDVF